MKGIPLNSIKLSDFGGHRYCNIFILRNSQRPFPNLAKFSKIRHSFVKFLVTHQNINPPAVSMPISLTSGTVSSGIELSYPLPHTLSSTIGYNLSPIFSVYQNPTSIISVSHCLGTHVAQPMKKKYWQRFILTNLS